MNSLTDLSPRQLRQAADIKEKIDALTNELGRILNSSERDGAGVSPPKKTTMSPAVRARIAAAARARWARIKGRAASPAPATQPRRKMSAAAKARLAAIARARWRKARAAGKNAL
jgi:hypothetical protein